MKKQKISAKTVALMAMMIALAMIFSYVETMIPINFGIPGVNRGLANLVIVAGIYLFGRNQAFLISIVRIFLSGFN
ncbi:MAG: Gx transporter family protein [Eubacterium ramulus]